MRMQTEKIFNIKQKSKEHNDRNTGLQRANGLTLPEQEITKVQSESVAKVHR